MKIWLLNNRSNKNVYGTQRLIEEGKNVGVNIKFVAIEDIELVINSMGKESLFIKNKTVKLPNIILPRNNTSYQIKCIVDFLSKKGVKVINPNEPRFLAKDKFLSVQKLGINGIPIPKTILLKGIPNTNFIEEQLDYPIILKKIEGSHGKGIIKADNREDLEDIIEMLTEDINILQKNFILQEFVGEKAGQDIRIFVVGKKIIASMLRKGKDGDFKSNFSGGGEVFPHKITKKEKEIALKATKTIGLEIAGVDILFDKDGTYKVCEVNASPGFEGLEKATGINVAGEVIQYIISRVKK